MALRVMHTNLGRSSRAHDLLLQNILEDRIGVCAVAEPGNLSETSVYYLSDNKLAAIFINSDIVPGGTRLVHRGTHIVSIKCFNIVVTSCYISPNVDFNSFITFIDELTFITDQFRSGLIVCGDFNLRTLLRPSPNLSRKVEVFLEWAAEADMRWSTPLVNSSDAPTCVRPQGQSAIDLAWVSPDLMRRISGWRVHPERETLSDHLYVTFAVAGSLCCDKRWETRYNYGKMDVEMLLVSLVWDCCDPIDPTVLAAPDDPGLWLDRVMLRACRAAIPRITGRVVRRATHWWSDNIAELRADCVRLRRSWSRSRHRLQPDEIARRRRAYMASRKSLRAAIAAAKSRAWDELIRSLDEDMWGCLTDWC